MTTYGRTIPTIDLAVQRGNDETFEFPFLDGASEADFTGAVIVFRAVLGSTEIRLATDDSPDPQVTIDGGDVTVALTAAQTRSLRQGRVTPYELENFTDQKTLVQGTITANGGVNDDS